jgi:hypothetical protein
MEGLEGRKVIIFYNDFISVSRKEGVLTKVSETDYTLDNKIIIPKSRVVRVEVQE